MRTKKLCLETILMYSLDLRRKLSSLISSVFQAQIFTDGFVHCDPHPANVMWRKTKNGDVKLILLDHGLYKQIDDDFRINYASLWKALLMADIGQIQKSCSNLGIEEMVRPINLGLGLRSCTSLLLPISNLWHICFIN